MKTRWRVGHGFPILQKNAKPSSPGRLQPHPLHDPRRARFGLGYLPQEESFSRKLSVLDNLLAITLPGGEKRRLAIARSLCSDPTLLMLDEPFADIEPIAVDDIQRIVRTLRDHDGLADP